MIDDRSVIDWTTCRTKPPLDPSSPLVTKNPRPVNASPATSSPPYVLALLPCPSNTAAPRRARTLPAVPSASTLPPPTAK